MKKIVISSLLLSVTLLTGCQQNHDDSSHITHLSNGDVREVTVSVDELPTFLDHQPEQVQTIYRLAAKHEELLRSIPCYCGCAESANHRDNFECFVHEINENGEIVWDDHGTKCNVCLEIAANSIVLYEEGKSVKEIRSEIDNRYENGYAKPTPTPEV